MLDLIDTKGKKDIKSMTLEEVTAEMTAWERNLSGQSSLMTGFM